MRAAVVQLNSTEDTARNLERADALTREAAAAGAEVVLLPEKWTVLGTAEHLRAGAETPRRSRDRLGSSDRRRARHRPDRGLDRAAAARPG